MVSRLGFPILVSALSFFAACRTTRSALDGRKELIQDQGVPVRIDVESASEGADLPPSMWTQSQRESTAGFHYLVGELSLLRGETKSARALMESAFALDPNPFLGVKAVQLKLASADVESAKIDAQRLSLIYPRDSMVRSLYGDVLVVSRDIDKALAQYSKAIEFDPKNETAYLRLIELYQSQKKSDKSVATAKELVRRLPESLAGWTLLSRLYILNNNKKDALEPAKRAYDLQSQNPELALIYAIALELNGKSKEALPLYEQLFRANPTNQELTARMVEIYRDLGDLEDALALLDEVAKSAAPDKQSGILIQRAIVLWELKRFADASAILDKLYAEHPESDRLQYMAALGRERLEKWDEALTLYAGIPPESQFRVHGEGRRAMILRDRKRYDEALSAAEKLLGNEELGEDPYVLLASVYGEQEKFGKAVDVLKTGYQKYPDKHRLLFLQGIYLERSGKLDETKEIMREVIRREPDNASAFNFLGYLLAEQGKELDEAEKLVRRALELKPDEGSYLDSLGWIYFQQKQYEKARGYIERALAKSPEEGVIMEHLAEIELATGHKDKALQLLQHAVETKLEARDRPRIEKRLKDLREK